MNIHCHLASLLEICPRAEYSLGDPHVFLYGCNGCQASGAHHRGMILCPSVTMTMAVRRPRPFGSIPEASMKAAQDAD